MHSQKSSSSLLSHDLGDYIGMESCFDLKSTEVDDSVVPSQVYGGGGRGGGSGGGGGYQRWGMKREKKEKQYPPPMPSLARTGNLSSHMPWVMKKCYTNDGRLVILEEKVKHHEYFMAHRANGRLTLHLVPLDDDVLNSTNDPKTGYEDEEELQEEEKEEEMKHIAETKYDNDDEVEEISCGGDEGKNGKIEGITVEEKLLTCPKEAESLENKGVGIMKGGGGPGGDGRYYQCSSLPSENVLSEPEEWLMWKPCELIQI